MGSLSGTVIRHYDSRGDFLPAGMNQRFEHSKARVLGGIDNTCSDRVPAALLQRGTLSVKDAMRLAVHAEDHH